MPVLIPSPPNSPEGTRPMQRIGDLMQPKRAVTPLEGEAIREVHDLAAEWAAGRLPLAEVRRLSSGKQRWLATRFTPPNSPLFATLMKLLDALVADDGKVTEGGFFSNEELIDACARIVREDGRTLIQFPVRRPWKVKPDPETGQPGVPGEPVHRRPDERGPVLHSFSTVPPKHASRKTDREWWEE